MNILIIGSEGFIGNHCVAFFQQKGHSIYGADLTDYKDNKYHYTRISRLSPDFEQLFQSGIKYDVCINAAGNGNVQVSITKPITDFESNCTDVFTILDCIRRYTPGCKYIQLSSAAVYGNPEKLPVTETTICSPLSPYGWHKLIAEKICLEHVQLYGLPISIVRPFSVYGPGLRKQLFWDIYQRSKNEKRIVLSGTGNESRDFIYITDLILAFDILINKSPMRGEIYNIASCNEITIREVATYFCSLLSGNPEVEFNGFVRQGDPLNWRADITKLTGFGFKNSVSIEAGLKKTAAWLISQ